MHTPPELPSTHDQHPITYHPPQDPDAEALSNPHTPAIELARIAATRPDLHPAIAAHPHCYPALHQWIDQYQAATTGSPAPANISATSPAPAAGPATAGTTTPQSDQAQTTPYPASTTDTSTPAPTTKAPSTPTTTGNQTPGTPGPQGPSRRTINRALPLLAGGAALATLSALGTWGLSHYLSEEHRTFSMSALSPDFTRGVTEAWSVEGHSAIISAKGDLVFVSDALEKVTNTTSPHRIYTLSESGLGTPVEISTSPWETQNPDIMKFSVNESWWGSSPIWRDKIIDPHSKNVTAVPWDAASYLFLGAVDDSSALLLKKPPADALNDTVGPISAIDRQGKTLWSTADSYWNAFFDPMQPDILIGYQGYQKSELSFYTASTPHIINTTTGETIAQLSPSNGLIVCTDGVVTVTGYFSESETVTARAFSFTGEPQWEQKIGNCEDIFFAGTPALDVVRRSLDELTGMAAVVTENGTVLVFNGESHGDYVSLSLRNKDGSTGPAINFHQPNTRILADGSGALTRRSDNDPSIDFVDFTTGKTKKCSDSDILDHDENDYYYRQSVKEITCLDFIPRHTLGMNRNCLIDISSSKVTCYVPKK